MTETLYFTEIFDLIIECGKCLIDYVELVTTVKFKGHHRSEVSSRDCSLNVLRSVPDLLRQCRHRL